MKQFYGLFPTGWLLLFSLLCYTAAGCGKRGRPLPPVERIPQRTELLSGVQRGNQVLLQWPAPLRKGSDGSVQSIRRIDVYRLSEKSNAPLPLTETDFATRATLIGSLDNAALQQKNSGTLVYIDTLQFGETPARLRYALRYVNSSGQRAAFSNFLLIEPAARVAQPPVLEKPRESENALTLQWAPPPSNLDGSTPVNLAGYNVYRVNAAQTGRGDEPLNGPTPISGTEFSDRDFRFGEQYTYLVRAVSLGSGGQLVESLNSNTVSALPLDHYPPSPPANLSLAVSPNGSVISLFFPANPERDVVGYYLYRTTDETQPLARWSKLNSEPLTRTTFRDDKVEAGRKYFYYLVALDSAGNLSAPSAVVAETVPSP